MRLACAPLALLLAGAQCSEAPRDEASAAEFRWQARAAYAELDNPCAFGPKLSRAEALADVIPRMAALETRLAVTRWRAQLDVARADMAYARRLNAPNCNTNGLFPATRRIRWAKEDIERAIPAMAAIAAARSAPPIPIGVPAAAGAEFRTLARRVVGALTAQCPISEANAFHTLDGARAEVAAFEQRIAATPFAPDFAMAKADAAYEQSVTLVECIDPDTDADARIQQVTRDVSEAIARMDRIVAGK